MEEKPAPTLEAAFDRGDFATVRSLAHAIRSEASSTEAERATADDYLRRIEPPPAARFALWLTATLVTVLSVYFALLHKHG